MSLPLLDEFISIQEAAKILGVSTKTLRRWEKSGKFIPQRTKGNHRRYAKSDVLSFNTIRKPNTGVLSTPFLQDDSFMSLSKYRINYSSELKDFLKSSRVLKKGLTVGLLALTITLGTGKYALDNFFIKSNVDGVSLKQSQQGLNNSAVLGDSTQIPNYVFKVNVPAKFYETADFLKDITVQGKTIFLGGINTENGDINAGTGKIIASNVIYGLTVGDGLSLSGVQTPEIINTGVLSVGGKTGALSLAAGAGMSVSGLTVTNTDLGSSQNIFKTITIDETSFSAGSNTDALTFAAGTNINLTSDTTNKKITINALADASGWTDDGAIVRLSTSTDKVGIGTTSPTNTLDVAGTLGVLGAVSLSSTLDILGATTITPISNGNTTSLTVRGANNSTGNILDITNTSGSTSFLSISNNGSLTVGGSTLTNAGLLESSGAIHLTNAANTIVGTAILGGWTMNSNTYTYRRTITVTNTSGSTLPKNYQISVNLSSSASNQVYTNSQTASPYKDFRIAWDNTGSVTEIARNVSSFTSSNVSFAFQLAGDISAGETNTYYIYYSNSAIASISAAYSSYAGDVQLDSADSISNWVTGDSVNYASVLETTIKQEGTGSVKSAALAGTLGTLSTTSQNQLPQSLRKAAVTGIVSSGINYLYLLGGNNDSTDQTTVYKATIDSSGNIGAFSTTSQGQLPQALSGHAVVSNFVSVSIDGGTGADGTLDLSLGGGAGGCSGTGLSWDNATLTCTIATATKSIFNFTTINIPSGRILTTSGTNFSTLKATGSVVIAGTINLNSKGFCSSGPGVGGAGESYDDGEGSYWAGGGGGGFGGAGGSSSYGTSGGLTYDTLSVGSGGINSCGGGGIRVSSLGSITINSGGIINANGSNGAAYGNGGGSGGKVLLEAVVNVVNSGLISANGGSGGAGRNLSYTTIGSGGSGGGGRINFVAEGSVTQGSTSVTGGSNGGSGQIGVSVPSSYVYILGGLNGSTRQTTVYKSTINSSLNLGTFSTTSQGQLPVALSNLSVNSLTISSTSYLYVLGGNSASSDQATVYKATIDGSGNVGAFSTTSQGQLPQTLSQQSSVIVSIGGTNYIYVLGGINGATAQNTVYKATINSSGNIGAFSAVSQTQLPAAIYDASSFTAIVGTTNYIYLVGGKNSAGNPVNTIYRGTLDASGNVTAWTASGTLPQNISSSAAVTSSAGGSNSLYLIGGANPSAISTVYKALINDMSGFTMTKTLSSAADLSNKNNIQFGVYSSQTGSFNIFEFSQNGSSWTQCANNSDFSNGNFSVSSANTWETKTCDISSVSNASKSAILYFRTRVSANQTSNFTTYIDNVQALMNATTISNTSSFAQAVLGASDLNLNAQGSGMVKVNYDAVNGLAGTGGLAVYDGSASALLTVANSGNIIATGNISGLTGISSSGNITFSSFTNNGGVVYANSSGVLAQTVAGTSSQCLLGGTSPLFGTCSPFQQVSGAILPTNSTLDFLIGGNSTASAKFSYTGIATGQAIASISGRLLIYPNNGWGGQVGINTLSPTAYLDVVGTASLGGQLTFRSGFGTIQTTANQGLIIGGNTTGNITFSPGAGATGFNVVPGLTDNIDLGTSMLQWRNIYGQNIYSNGSLLSNLWQRNSGAIAPLNITDDLVLGAISTASAQFSVTGIATNKLIASLSGQLIVMPQNGWGGQVGIGTTVPQFKLDLQDTQTATVTAMFANLSTSSTANVLALKVATSTPTLSNYFTSFLDGNGAIVGKIQGNGSGGVTYSTSGLDFAEYFRKESLSEVLNSGDIVCLGLTGGAAKCENNNNILGVVSDKAGFIGGGQHDNDPNYVAVGLIGQLKINVSSESGQINPGDSITVDSKGFAVKANYSGQIVGQALESYMGQESGAILTRINVTWYQPPTDIFAFLNSATNATISASFASPDTLDIKNATISSLMVLGKATVNDLGVTGTINSGLLVINGLDSSVGSRAGVSINTLSGDLYLQNEGWGGINMLAGKVTIDKNGDVNVKGVLSASTVEANQYVVKGTGNIGSATLIAGKTQIEIDSPSMRSTSKVFIVPTTLTSVPLSVTHKANGKFVISVQVAQTSNITFDWWVVGTQ